MTTQESESTPAAPPPSTATTTIHFDVPYPAGERDKVSVAFRIFLAIPIAFILSTIAVGSYSLGWSAEPWTFFVGGTAGILVVGPALMMVFRQKYPRWWFDFNVQLLKFGARVLCYVLLLRDEYPATDEDQQVVLEVDYPDVSQLQQYHPLFKWILAIPHYIVLCLLGVGVAIATVVAWFSILITGEYPRGLYDFVVRSIRWNYRVISYAFLLTTDEYPHFRLE
jgi:hypothetical protein